MQTSLAVFDFDGTLFFETFEVNAYAINKVLELSNLPALTTKELMQATGNTLVETSEHLLKTNDAEKIQKFCDDILSYAVEYIVDHTNFKPGVIEMLKSLYAENIKLCICSNGDKQYIYSILQKFDLIKYFDTIWYSRAGVPKSEALKILKKQYKTDRCIMVGDRKEDILAGKMNSCTTIGVLCEYDNYDVSGEETFDISTADYISSSHSEIGAFIINLFKGK
jgi:phosphoglycolate phosphatase